MVVARVRLAITTTSAFGGGAERGRDDAGRSMNRGCCGRSRSHDKKTHRQLISCARLSGARHAATSELTMQQRLSLCPVMIHKQGQDGVVAYGVSRFIISDIYDKNCFRILGTLSDTQVYRLFIKE